jgi:hypothetical protein
MYYNNMKDPKKNPLYDEQLLNQLLLLKEKDPNAFMDLVFSSLKSFPDAAIEDDADIDSKIKAITKMMNHYEGTETYEKCAFLLNLMNQIKDEKGHIRNNE